MNDKGFLLCIAVFTLLLIGGAVFFLSKAGQGLAVVYTPEAKVEVDNNSHAWGEIKLNGGLAEAVFSIKNVGSQPLQLFGISTSCTCTTAQLLLGEQQSPRFRMHGKSGYMLEVLPQQTAQLKVVFDPAFHGPSGIGPINRQVKVQTNDVNQPELIFVVTAQVTN